MDPRRRWRQSAGACALVAMLAGAPVHAITLFDPAPNAEAELTAVYEYYDAAHDHYFVTAVPEEIAALESGGAPGWARTSGEPAFLVFSAPVRARYVDASERASSPVCRYFIPPASHFISASPSECEAVGAAHPEFVLESAAAFHAWQPNARTGQCPTLFAKIGGFEFAPVYRLWNASTDTNHRFTTSRSERARMIDAGWVPEGAGEGVAMCVPAWHAP